jgi:hypothetical protein
MRTIKSLAWIFWFIDDEKQQKWVNGVEKMKLSKSPTSDKPLRYFKVSFHFPLSVNNGRKKSTKAKEIAQREFLRLSFHLTTASSRRALVYRHVSSPCV